MLKHKPERFIIRKINNDINIDDEYHQMFERNLQAEQGGEGMVMDKIKNAYSKTNNWLSQKLGNRLFTKDDGEFGKYMPEPTNEEIQNSSIPEPYKSLYLKNPEVHYFHSNFMGPGTKLLYRLQRNDRPTSVADKFAKQHDIDYFNIGKMINDGKLNVQDDSKQINDMIIKADNDFINGIKNTPAYGKSQVFRSWIGRHIISAKKRLDQLGVSNRLTYIDIDKDPKIEVKEDKTEEEKPVVNHVEGSGIIPRKFTENSLEQKEPEYECCENCHNGEPKKMCMKLPGYKLRMKFQKTNNI